MQLKRAQIRVRNGFRHWSGCKMDPASASGRDGVKQIRTGRCGALVKWIRRQTLAGLARGVQLMQIWADGGFV